MPNQAAVARTPGAKRAGPGEHLFDLANLAKVNKIKGGPDYSSVEGSRQGPGPSRTRIPTSNGFMSSRAPCRRRSAARKSRPGPAR
jgi:hypothetical protein